MSSNAVINMRKKFQSMCKKKYIYIYTFKLTDDGKTVTWFVSDGRGDVHAFLGDIGECIVVTVNRGDNGVETVLDIHFPSDMDIGDTAA